MKDHVQSQERLSLTPYLVDEGRPNIRIIPRAEDSAALRALTRLCPANCYHFGEDDRVVLLLDGCLECGTCRTVCAATGEVEWTYPTTGQNGFLTFG
ncbi:MAG: ferredoxin family protein [Mangrovicoccus sp.]|nr:ferredoxin family protein [Mangrovicoccus sp.]